MKSKEFLQNLQELAKQLRADIEANCAGWDNDPVKIAERRKKVFDKKTGFKYLCQNYFPHYLRNPHPSELHEYLFDRLPKTLTLTKCIREALAAPRGEAKSTIVTRLFTLWCILTNQKKYIAIISDTISQSAEFLLAIKMELEFNPRIKTDFPEAFGVGSIWKEEKIVTKNNIKVQCAGAGKSLRGLVYGAYRPDLTILDDLENDKNVLSPMQRDKLYNWLVRTVLKLGVAGEKYDVIYIGTVLHYDSVLNRILHNKAWHSKVFKALIRYPDNMSLWDEWEAIFLSDGEDVAEKFYLNHKKEMDKGSKVSWVARPLYELMKIRVSDGHDAFDTELQNDPSSGSDAPFNDSIYYWHELPQNLIYFGAIDPSLGKHGASRDPSAIIIGGYHQATGVLYILVADIKKRLPDRIISDIIRYQAQYNCLVWAVESVQFQEFFRTELVKRGAVAGVHIPAQPVIPHNDKLLRIESLQPHMFNKVILFHKDQSTLIDQFRHFPKADHDDGCDGVEMLWKLVTGFSQSARREVLDIPMPSLY